MSAPARNLLAEINGEHVPLGRADWVLWAPCGCPCGVCIAAYAPTEEDAWKEFYDHKRDRVRAQRDGYRLVLMTHARYSAEVCPRMTARCPHEPGGEVQLELPGGETP
jgi:hypothetical protein